MPHLFCFGLGYTARRLANQLAGTDWTVSGTARSQSRVEDLHRAGFRGYVFDSREASADIARALDGATHVLLSIPPDKEGDPALRLHGQDIAASPSITWIGYLSTVGVYGDADGGWVDETTKAQPGSERGRRRLDAEIAWRELGERAGKTVNIFRLPGIYGPGRSAIDDVRAGTARSIIKPGQVFNRIHVEDIASTVRAAIAKPMRDMVYNVTDDEPCPPQDVVNFAAEILGAPEPPAYDFETAELSEMARSFYSESKRVANTRIKSELGVRLAFPTYREGLRSIAKDPNSGTTST